MGGLNVLVNNARIIHQSLIVYILEEDWDGVVCFLK